MSTTQPNILNRLGINRRRDGTIFIFLILVVPVFVVGDWIWNVTDPVAVDWQGTVTELPLDVTEDSQVVIGTDDGKQSIQLEEGLVHYQPKPIASDKISIEPDGDNTLLGDGFSAKSLPAKPLEVSSEKSGMLALIVKGGTHAGLRYNRSEKTIEIAGVIRGEFPALEFSLLNADIQFFKNSDSTPAHYKFDAVTVKRYPVDDLVNLVLEIQPHNGHTKLILSRRTVKKSFRTAVKHGEIQLRGFRPKELSVNGKSFNDSWNEINATLIPDSPNGLTISVMDVTDSGFEIRIHGRATLSGNEQLVWDMNPNWIADKWRKGNSTTYVIFAALLIAANALIGKLVDQVWSRNKPESN